jgi:hypothetical protein
VSAVWESGRERKRRSNGDDDCYGEDEITYEGGRGRDSKNAGVSVGVCYLVLEMLLADSLEGLIALQAHAHGNPQAHSHSSRHSQPSTLKSKMWRKAYEGNVHSGAFEISDIQCSVLSPSKRKVMLRLLAARNSVRDPRQVMRLTALHCSTVLYCTSLYCTVLYCTVLYCTALHCTVPFPTLLT